MKKTEPDGTYLIELTIWVEELADGQKTLSRQRVLVTVEDFRAFTDGADLAYQPLRLDDEPPAS